MPTRQCCTTLFCCTLLLSNAGAADELESGALEPPIPEVLTPVRLKQPRTEVPASVTVIDRELIVASGIRELPEVLRLVPGMVVGARSGWDYVVSYHGTNRRNSRRMQVLIDGRSVYQAGLATIDWNDIPIAIEDIERIEVVRGPDTSAYGANAFLGIINIITRHPDDSPRAQLKVTAGTQSAEDYYLSTSGNGSAGSYRLSAASRHDSGFDHKESGADRRDSKNLHWLNGRWLFAPTAHWNIDVQAGYKNGTKTEDPGDASMRTPPDKRIEDYFLSLGSQHFFNANNSLKWQLDYAVTDAEVDWLGCVPQFYFGIPSAATVCGDTNEDSTNSRLDLDLQYTLLGDTRWKLVSGAHLQNQRVDSETFYNGTVKRSTYQLFANFEYRLLEQLAVTIAGSEEIGENHQRNFSPRLALLFYPSADHSFRAVYSEAIRTPDLFEEKIDWSYTARNLRPLLNGRSTATIAQRTQAPGNLHEEKIRSRELGYYGLWLNRRLAVDIKGFRDDLDDLISETLNFDKFRPTNNSSLNLSGFETEIDFRVNSDLRLRLGYSLIHSDTVVLNEEDLTPRKSGSVGLLYTLPQDWQFSTFYYYAHPVNNNKFTRLDARIAKRLPAFGGKLTAAGVIQHYFYQYPDLFRDNQYDRDNRIYLTLDMTF